jgi:hypothetical protein
MRGLGTYATSVTANDVDADDNADVDALPLR